MGKLSIRKLNKVQFYMTGCSRGLLAFNGHTQQIGSAITLEEILLFMKPVEVQVFCAPWQNTLHSIKKLQSHLFTLITSLSLD